MSSVVVSDEQAGGRLDVVTAAAFGWSRSRAATRIANGEVTVDDEVVAKQLRVRAGQRLEWHEPPPARVDAPPSLPPVRHADDALLVVAKPAGLVVHPGPGHPAGTLVDALQAAGYRLAPVGAAERPGVVHRLDRDTSGLLAIALTGDAYDGLVAALRERRVERRYLTLVRGAPAQQRGRIEAPIGRDPRVRTRNAVVANGREAVTRYRVLATGRVPGLPAHRAEVALLACQLETGRTHQIRVHLTALGHAVVGDPVYGPASDVAAGLGLSRPFLHAEVLGFDHPVSGEPVRCVEPLPTDLRDALDLAGIAEPGADEAGP